MGDDEPPAVMPPEIDVSSLKRECRTTFGYVPKKFQIDGTVSILKGDDTVIIAPAGSGKSLLLHLMLMVPNGRPQSNVCDSYPTQSLQVEQTQKQALRAAIALEMADTYNCAIDCGIL